MRNYLARIDELLDKQAKNLDAFEKKIIDKLDKVNKDKREEVEETEDDDESSRKYG